MRTRHAACRACLVSSQDRNCQRPSLRFSTRCVPVRRHHLGLTALGINRGQYDQAHELHMPLMTNYFTEAGAWVLAAKRLVEVAKICLH